MNYYKNGRMGTSEFENKVSHDSTRLRAKYIFAIAVMATFIVVGFMWLQYSISMQEQDAHLINLAGRQRMLSQQFSKSALALDVEKNNNSKTKIQKEIKDIMELWISTHRTLIQGDSELMISAPKNKSIKKKYQEIGANLDAMVRAANTILESPNSDNQESIAQIMFNEQLYLHGMNKIVFMYDNEAGKRVQNLKHTQLVIMCLTLFVLLLVGALIFEPASRLVVRQFTEIASIAGDREKAMLELQGALKDVKQLEGLLPICASCKKIRNDKGNWTGLELYLESNSHAQFSHGICPDCVEGLYPNHGQHKKST